MPGTNVMPRRPRPPRRFVQRRDGVVIGHAHRADAGAPGHVDEHSRLAEPVGRGRMKVEIDDADSHASGVGAAGARGRPAAVAGAPFRLTRLLYSRISSSRCCFLFLGELHEDLLAFGVLEPLAVLLEEAVRAALAADADQQRLLVVDALGEPVGALGEQPVGGALEKQERRTRLQLRIGRQQLRVARLERAEMLLFLFGELLEDRAPARDPA